MRLHNRVIRPGFWTDTELIINLPIEGRMYYMGLVQLADDSGCLEDDILAHKIHLFPGDADITTNDIEEWCEKLKEMGKLIPYEASGKKCLFLKNFHKHQELSSPAKPECPLPPWITFKEYEGKNPSKYILDGDVTEETDGDIEDWMCLQLEIGNLVIDGEHVKTVNRQVRYANSYLDVVVVTDRPTPYVFEIKKSRLSKAALDQIERYIALHRVNKEEIIPILIGSGVATSFDIEKAKDLGVTAYSLEGGQLRRIIGDVNLWQVPRDNKTSFGNKCPKEEPEPEPEPEPITTTSQLSTDSSDQIDLDSPALQLAVRLRDRILERDPNTRTPKSLKSWIAEADRLLRLDKRPYEEAVQLIAWCQQDPFWSANVLSMSTFRKQYDRLKRKAEQTRAPTRSYAGTLSTSDERMRAYEEVVQRA